MKSKEHIKSQGNHNESGYFSMKKKESADSSQKDKERKDK